MVVMECYIGDEWVLNTVSLNGVHKLTDAWRGPAKMRHVEDGAARFIYNKLFLVPNDELSEIKEFTFQVLDALGFQNGAAHTELIWSGRPGDKPRLCEVNPRCAGGLPRTPHHPNQLEVLAMSLHDTSAFMKLPDVPSEDDCSAAAVFLVAPHHGWLSASSLSAFAALDTFAWFDRGLQKQTASSPFKSQPVRKTIGLCSSPGVVVLHGAPDAVKRDADQIRTIESHAYTDLASEAGEDPPPLAI